MPNKDWKEYDVCTNNLLKSIFQIHLNVLENSWNVNKQYLFTFHPCTGVLVWDHDLVLQVGVVVMISLIVQLRFEAHMEGTLLWSLLHMTIAFRAWWFLNVA